nr:MAG TPA: hypothetical protein [Caudoviricetes sp.]
MRRSKNSNTKVINVLSRKSHILTKDFLLLSKPMD